MHIDLRHRRDVVVFFKTSRLFFVFIRIPRGGYYNFIKSTELGRLSRLWTSAKKLEGFCFVWRTIDPFLVSSAQQYGSSIEYLISISLSIHPLS